MLKTETSQDTRRAELITQYDEVRRFTEKICQPLEVEDYVIQAVGDASPPKWHLGHTSWFFEQFVLHQYVKNYHPYREEYYFVFNSYYNSFGDRVLRTQRGTLSRPTVREVYEYRTEIDGRVRDLIESIESDKFDALTEIIRLGLHHEQQHQELTLTDTKWNFGANPLKPEYRQLDLPSNGIDLPEPRFIEFEGGIAEIGHEGTTTFAYDNESPKHKVFLNDFALMDRLVTCGEYLAFIEDGGYETANLWLDDGWTIVNEEQWRHPHYWEKTEEGWKIFTLGGMRPLKLDEPVCHVSLFEAAAFARWSGKRLPTEFEWERAAQTLNENQLRGNFVDDDYLHPLAADPSIDGLRQMFGDVWEWTNSAYLPYPGYLQTGGALGEYNGKFMSGQMVCRGGSCLTSRNHLRISYRNFFQPEKRWQVLGFRLASDR